ncbi:spermatogenesis-associated protein 48 [Sceloporus undulatus]|uniref:spermatogenesis-associated protein 48 n=1 Tax=Sceloporus undulatus TaxID=8520 RepID=UPI001C4DA51F|nr:spermatogenesis-associated protein 48 [Sceloporus undulatus]
MASQVTAKQFSPLPMDSLHKMHQQQYEGLLKRMYMPFVRGPENRHLFPSFGNKYSGAFLKSSPIIPPEDKSYLLAPHRDDVSVINPCSGFLSPRAVAEIKAYQQIPYGENIEIQTSDKDVQSQQGTPVPHWTGQITKRRSSLLLEDVSQDQQWNTRAVPDISFRAKIGGRTSPVKVIPGPPRKTEYFSSHLFAFHLDPEIKSKDSSSEACRDEKARKYMYTSTTQRGYEEVPWDRILLPKIRPPDSVLELKGDCVSQNFAMKRYEPAAEISQVVGDLWNRFQRRSFILPHRPVNFVSSSSRTQQLPLYTGCAGAENVDDLDNQNVDVIIRSRVRSAKPHYVKSSYKPNTFGYTGKVHWSATQPVHSNLPPISPSVMSQMYGVIATHGQPSEFPHWGPLSQIITPTEPQNSFNKKEKDRITT